MVARMQEDPVPRGPARVVRYRPRGGLQGSQLPGGVRSAASPPSSSSV
jgi:hypothetical protein